MIALSNNYRDGKVKTIDASPTYADHCVNNRIEIIKTNADGQVYEDLLSVRCQVNDVDRETAIDSADDDSDLYCVYVNGVPAGTLRVTCAAHCKLDCEEFYPADLLDKYRNCIGTTSGFAILHRTNPGLKLSKVLIEAAWHDQLKNGYRVDVINAHERGVCYYQRLGYKVVEGSFFLHPRLGTPSYVMIMRADPNGGSPIDHCFEDVADPVTEAELKAFVQLKTLKPRRRRKQSEKAA